MAAWRMANLAPRHLCFPTHLIISDRMGSVVKGYSNDEVPVPRDDYGGIETERLCRRWGTRRTFESHERFGTHNQYTDTPGGTFFCTTHVEAGREPALAVTLGVRFADAHWFRGRETPNRETSTCPDPACCRMPSPELTEKWSNKVIVSARSQHRILRLLAPAPYPPPTPPPSWTCPRCWAGSRPAPRIEARHSTGVGDELPQVAGEPLHPPLVPI